MWSVAISMLYWMRLWIKDSFDGIAMQTLELYTHEDKFWVNRRTNLNHAEQTLTHRLLIQ